MADAKRDVPHFYASADLDMEEAVRVREQLVTLGGAFEGVTVTHLLVKACGMALRRVPEMNASPDVDGIVVHEHVNVGIATATEQGLLVPVVATWTRRRSRTSSRGPARSWAGRAPASRAATISPARRSRSRTSACSRSRTSPRS
jgi:pyruvate dehydrogenase E2 component (dihydrolipoamide acetyltransferase)